MQKQDERITKTIIHLTYGSYFVLQFIENQDLNIPSWDVYKL